MTGDCIPRPGVMPVDRQYWLRQLNLSNFINAHYEYADLQQLGDIRSILVVGPGQALDVMVLKWRGYFLTTLDIDETFAPNVVGSVHDMSMFADGQFGAVIASHVLEHLAEPYLDVSLREIARVARYALIYLPVAGRHSQIRLIPGVKGIDISIIIDLFNYLRRPSGLEPRYAAQQHYWEVGMRGFRVRDIMRRMSAFFNVLKVYRNRDWLPSVNFVMSSKMVE